MEAGGRAEAAAGGSWWIFLITGVAWLVISLVVLRFNVTSVAAVGVLVGVILLLVGVNEFMALAIIEGWKWLHALLGVLFVVGGIWALINPIGTFVELAAILGFLLLFKGAFDVTASLVSKEVNPVWGLGLAVGIIEILLAFWVSQQFFGPRATLILIYTGLATLLRGISEIVLAFHVRKVGREASLI